MHLNINLLGNGRCVELHVQHAMPCHVLQQWI